MSILRGLSLPLMTTGLGQFEFENAVRFAVFRKVYSARSGMETLSAFQKDMEQEKIRILAIPIDEIVGTARQLSNHCTLDAGHRSYDILHVAAAIVGGAKHFLSFDKNQRKLAESEGLELSS